MHTFQNELKIDLNTFLSEELKKYPREDLLKIDLHCHDYNSDEPDELLGRILNVPETWISTKRVIEELKKNGCDALTLTNHNNARSCYDMQKKGFDVLTAAEFSCWVPDFHIGIHVLTYGFTPEQEKILDKLRKNVYSFQEYARTNDIPTIWAHPLYHYASDKMPPQDFFDKMLLIFERFEMLNGQRDTWQNLLVKEWINSTTPEKINQLSEKFNINTNLYCRNPYKKVLAGGSDSHSGFFSGLTGTYLYVPQLKKRALTEKKSQLALEAIRNGNMFPYGNHQNSEKLIIAFLNYVCQIAINYEDPGLMRILLHKGKYSDKIISMLVSNAFAELQRHRVTMSFVKIFHNCMLGKSPTTLKKLIIKSAYKPIFDEIVKMSKDYQKAKSLIAEEYYKSICSINNHLNRLLFIRLEKKLNKPPKNNNLNSSDVEKLISQLELPSSIRAYTEKKRKSGKDDNNINIEDFLDGLSFPFLASAIVLSAHFTGARVMFNTRPFLKDFSEHLNKYRHPERALWLTDTFDDKNGVSVVLQAMHSEIKRRKLPIDILVCSNTLQSDDNLIVMKSLGEYRIPFYTDQPVRVPNFVELHNLFHEREYDRIICSTEGIMGAMGLYLKYAYSVPASFFIHTDWVMFSQKVLNFDSQNINRVRRFLRTYYGAFDRLFVLNKDHRKWLTGNVMNIPEEKVCLTAHWVDDIFKPQKTTKIEALGIENSRPVMLYVGRVSKEKGVLELPYIYKEIKKAIPNIALFVAGQGPAAEELKEKLPEAYYSNWISRKKLPEIYSAADILVFPSKFDTFSCVVLESLSCGLPVIAYNNKGPKDIIIDEKCGFLVNSKDMMANQIIGYLHNNKQQKDFRKAAVKRADEYDVDTILDKFVADVEL